MVRPKSQLETPQIFDPPTPAWRAEVFDGHAHGVARRNQRLPHTWTALSPIDIDDLVAALERTVDKNVGSRELEIALTIAAILTTGRSLRSVIDFALDPTGRLLDDDTQGLIRFGSGWVWSLKSHGTQLDRKEQLRRQSPRELFVSCERRLLLQCPSLVQRIANKLSEKRKRASGHRVQPIVGLTSGEEPDAKKIRAELDSWLRSARREGPRRKLSAANLRHWLVTEIARVAGADLGAARAISGAKLEVEVAGTYGVYSVDHLRRIYREVIRPFDSKLAPMLELPIGYVGRSRTPERQTISKFAANLQKPL